MGKAAATGLGIAVPVIGVLWKFHEDRTRRSDERFDGVDRKVTKLDVDFDGLFKQLAAMEHDVEARFLTKDEHHGAINRLDASIRDLNGTVGTLNGHLLNIARDRRAGGVG